MTVSTKPSARITRERETRAKHVLGRSAFARISAVEGIRPSGELEQQLRELEAVSPALRRARLSELYGRA